MKVGNKGGFGAVKQCHLVNDGGRREGNKMLRRNALDTKKA